MNSTYVDSALESLCATLHGLGVITHYEHMHYTVDSVTGAHVWHTATAPLMETGHVSYGDLKPMGRYATIDWDCMLTPNFMTYSDYSGSTVERSNCDEFLKKFGELPGVYETCGGYGTRGVVIKLSAITDEMIEELSSLSDYPVMDDEAHSNLEMEIEAEDWKSWIEGDFKRAIVKKFPHMEDDRNDRWDGYEKLYYELKERTNTYWNAESAVGGHVDIDKLVAGIVPSDLPETGE